MRFLVTGAGGMIGANLALHLESQGHEVHALDHFSVGTKDNLKTFNGPVHVGDIRTFDYTPLGKLDGIFHQAAITDTTVTDRTLMRQVNVDAFVRLLEFAGQSGCPKVVYASSAATYGKGRVPMREDAILSPANIYGESKVIMEKTARGFVERNPQVQAVGLRYFNVYGPLEFHKGAAASMIYQLYRQMAQGQRPRIFKWGEQYRDFIYVKDVVQANWKAFEFGGSDVFNVGTGRPTTFNQVISILNKILGTHQPIEYFDNPYGFYQEATQADATRANSALGFKAAYTSDKGIDDYVDFLKSRGA